jgi:hypothetical protein
MEETKPKSKFRRFADRIAVEEEPGLSTSQLMLTNYDLKPVEVSYRFAMLPFVLRPSAACQRRECKSPILDRPCGAVFGDMLTAKSPLEGHGDGQTTLRSGSQTVLISIHGV